MANKFGKCALCGKESTLELSHIIPKMAIRALKKTSIGNVRSTDNPNRTIQDSEKHYMLCGECEDLFSKDETYFSNNIFYPYLNDNKVKFDYDNRLFYYITSVNWRSLYRDILDFVENHVVGIEALNCLIDSEKIMRDFLLGRHSDLGNIENHILFFDDVKDMNIKDLDNTELRPNTTFHRSILSYTVCYEREKTYVTFTNMLGIFLFTFYHFGTNEKWKNTKIDNSNGTIKAEAQQVHSVIGNEFEYIMNQASEASNNISDNQQQKIIQRIQKVGDSIKDYPVYQDYINDEKLKNK